MRGMLKSLAVSITLSCITPTFSAESYLTDAGFLEAALPTQSTDFESFTGHSKHNYPAKETEFMEFVARVKEPLQIEDVQKDLTRGNYKEKLQKLLCWEEKTHIEILEKK